MGLLVDKCVSSAKVGDVVRACFNKNGRNIYYPTPLLTDYQFDFPIIKISNDGTPIIGFWGPEQVNIYGFWSDNRSDNRYGYLLYKTDIRVVKIIKNKK